MALTGRNEEFRLLAEQYCAAIEQPRETHLETLLSVRRTLIALYEAGFGLEEIEGESNKALPDFTIDSWKSLSNQIGAWVGGDYFQITFHPFRKPPETPLFASLSDALADIWRDLKPGLMALQENETRWAARVIWEWKFGFETHWGEHAVDAIWGIHKLLRDEPESISEV